MKSYNGLFIRDAFNETGADPTPANGNYWQSPDIIPYQHQTLSFKTAASTYNNGQDLGLPLLAGQSNNIFIRAVNSAPAPQAATVNLYWMPASLLMVPNQWVKIKTPSENGVLVTDKQDKIIPPGNLAMLTAPFILQEVNPPTGGEDVGLIAVVNNDGIPFPIPPAFSSNSEYVNWMIASPNIAQRNVNYYSGPGAVSFATQFGNLNSSSATMAFMFSGPASIAGARLVVKCDDPRLDTPLNFSAEFSRNGDRASLSFGISIPGNIGGANSALMTLSQTIAMPHGKPVPAGTQLDTGYFQVLDENADPMAVSLAQDIGLPIMENGKPVTRVTRLLTVGCAFSIFNASNDGKS